MNDKKEFMKCWEKDIDYRGTCELCGKDDESVAPFGPDEKFICRNCGNKNPALALAQMLKMETSSVGSAAKLLKQIEDGIQRVKNLKLNQGNDRAEIAEMINSTVLKDGECGMCHRKSTVAPLGVAGMLLCTECATKPENKDLATWRVKKVEAWAAHEVAVRHIRQIEMEMAMKKRREEAYGEM